MRKSIYFCNWLNRSQRSPLLWGQMVHAELARQLHQQHEEN